MARAVSVSQLLNKKRKLLEFEGEFLESFGKPELKGSWFIYGGSGHGKSNLVAKLIKYMSQFERVAYNSLEEGDSLSMAVVFKRAGLTEVKGRVILLDREPINELKERLRRRKAPKIVVIDSVQYARLKYDEWVEILEEFQNVLFIFISHADGKKPRGETATSLYYNAFIKIRVEGHTGYVASRYNEGESKPFISYKEGAEKYTASGLLK